MDNLNFDSSSYVLYQILPDHKKIDFLNNSFNRKSLTKLTEKLYKQHLKHAFQLNGNHDIPILTYTTKDGAKVNVFFYKDHVHVNSNKLKPIHGLLYTAMIDGNILITDPGFKKTKKNRDQYHLRYYRVYKKITPDDKTLPKIIFS